MTVTVIAPPAFSGDHAASEVRVLIADGQALVRAGFRVLLEAEPRIKVVGDAATGEEAVDLAARVRPHVVMIDSRLPGLDAVEATERMSSQLGLAVMVMMASESDDCVLAALRAGASGLLLKDTQPVELVRAIELLARREALISPAFTRRLITELASKPERSCPSSTLVDELTAREREVVALVGNGLGNNEIAERLVISPATAKTHVSRAMAKLHAHDRAKLVVFAYEAGLVAPGAEDPPPPGRPLSLAS